MRGLGHLLLQSFARLTYFIYSLDVRIKDFYKIKFLREHMKQDYLSTSFSNIKVAQNWAILAIYPRFSLQKSIERLISLLKNANYQVLCVVNENQQSADFITFLESLGCQVIARKNVGRDFGAYQFGINFLIRHGLFESTKHLILANDTCYFGPNVNKLEKFISQKEEWKALFVNFQYQVHAQSFFIAFNEKVVNSPAFKTFWEHYYPTSIRHRVINSGEMVLSKLLLKAGFRPSPFFTPSMLSIELIEKLNLSDKIAILEGCEVDVANLRRLGELETDILLEATRFVLDRKNPSHYFSLIGFRLFGIPLKLDLVLTGLFSRSSVEEALRFVNLPESELVELEKLMSGKGTSATTQGIFRIWRRFGLYPKNS